MIYDVRPRCRRCRGSVHKRLPETALGKHRHHRHHGRPHHLSLVEDALSSPFSAEGSNREDGASPCAAEKALERLRKLNHARDTQDPYGVHRALQSRSRPLQTLRRTSVQARPLPKAWKNYYATRGGNSTWEEDCGEEGCSWTDGYTDLCGICSSEETDNEYY